MLQRGLRPLFGAFASMLLLLGAGASRTARAEDSGIKPTPRGFKKAFDGETLNGWVVASGDKNAYVPDHGVLLCHPTAGNLFLDKQYSDFVFQFDFKLDHGANNGVGVRTPFKGDAAYVGMELQILDDDDPMYAHLEAGQYHSSIYKVVAAKRGSLKPAGQWNTEEIVAKGRHIKITVNGMVTVDADLNKVDDPETFAVHPGFRRSVGYLGFLGHGPAECAFRNIFVKDLSKPEQDNHAPEGFKALFNGKDLKGWKGLVSDPPHRQKMTAEQLKEAEAKATEEALKHWTVNNGVIEYDGKNNSLCTVKPYKDFELLVDWKINAKGDSGIYLRGSPQVQIWDNPLGSGGLYNNQKNPSNPTVVADKPVGEWNRFRILMIGDKVTVYLNDVLVVHNVTMENYWERDKPIYPIEQIELQHHGDHLWFKNIYVREINTAAPKK